LSCAGTSGNPIGPRFGSRVVGPDQKMGNVGERVAINGMSVSGFQSGNASGELKKDDDKFEAVNMNEARVGCGQFTAALYTC
jgi:hypothetical protein